MEPKHIIAGFTEDLDRMTSEFVEASPNLRLEDFFAYWKSSHLDCIFANRFDPRELLESITEMNKRLVAIVTCETRKLELRLVTLYMLLCLAVKQPKRLRRRIRLTCQDAIQLKKLCDQSRQSKGHRDADFCWTHLKAADSIDFVEERMVYGPSMLNSRVNHLDSDDIQKTDLYFNAKKETREFLSNKLEPNLTYLENLCLEYNQIRAMLSLDSVNDATVEMDSKGTVSDCLAQAKSLLVDFKASENL